MKWNETKKTKNVPFKLYTNLLKHIFKYFFFFFKLYIVIVYKENSYVYEKRKFWKTEKLPKLLLQPGSGRVFREREQIHASSRCRKGFGIFVNLQIELLKKILSEKILTKVMPILGSNWENPSIGGREQPVTNLERKMIK